jgi:hypothetical protein
VVEGMEPGFESNLQGDSSGQHRVAAIEDRNAKEGSGAIVGSLVPLNALIAINSRTVGKSEVIGPRFSREDSLRDPFLLKSVLMKGHCPGQCPKSILDENSPWKH